MSEEKPNLIEQGLFKRRTILLAGDITPESTTKAERQLLELQLQSEDTATLIINSGGGSTYDALRLCTVIKTILTIKIRGVVIERCGSAATFVLLHCHERIGTPYCHYLIHSGSRSKITIPVGQNTSDQLEQLLLSTRTVEEEVIGMYMRCLTPPSWKDRNVTEEEKRDFVQKLIDRGDQRFNADLSNKEALAAGLIERVEEGNIGIFG